MSLPIPKSGPPERPRFVSSSTSKNSVPGKPARRSFAEMCNSKCQPGFVLDSSIAIEIVENTVSAATKAIHKQTNRCIKRLKTDRNQSMRKFYLGMTNIPEIDEMSYDLDHAEMDSMVKAYMSHCKRDYGKSGLVLIAIITKQSIPEDCRKNWYIREPHEYAQMVEKRLIQIFQGDFGVNFKDERMVNKIEDTLVISAEEDKTHGVYMAFTMQDRPGRQISGKQASPSKLKEHTIPVPKAGSKSKKSKGKKMPSYEQTSTEEEAEEEEDEEEDEEEESEEESSD